MPRQIDPVDEGAEKISVTASDDSGPVRVVLEPASFSVNTIVAVVVAALLVIFVAGFVQTIFYSLSYLFFVIVLSIFFAYLLAPLVTLIRSPFKHRKLERLMPRSLAIAIAYVVVFTVVGIALANLVPRVVDQGREFGASLPRYATGIRQSLNDLNRRFDRLRVPEDIQTRINDNIVAVGDRVTAWFGSLVIVSVMYLPWLVVVPVLSFFFLKDVNQIRLAILRMFPAGRWRLRSEAVMEDINLTMAAYTRAQLLSCLLIGTVCVLGFYLIGLKYALLLGILAGIFEFVPMLGPLSIGIIATTTAAFGDDPRRAIYVAVFLVILRLFHDYVSYPRIVRGGIRMHPLLIIISILAGEQVAGIPGVFLAIPVVAVLTVFYRHVLEHRGQTRLFDKLSENDEGSLEENGKALV
ncbi:MAG: AI-2E family transporter [Acidobacteria bacterium]|nr:AI-2E family transporter [Acidobacteriota bacterium]